MDLFLRAFKKAENLNLAQRTEIILLQQRHIADTLKIWTWYLVDKTEIDIRDDACYDLIYKQAKRGMNAKRVNIIRYKKDDIPDIRSTCIFLASKKFIPQPFVITHKLGYYGDYSHFESISIDHFMNAVDINKAEVILELVNKIISFYNPNQLYVSSKHYFHDIATLKDELPWTGWITYLQNSIKLPTIKPTFCQTSQINNGTLFCTVPEKFDDTNIEHVQNALKLEKWFETNKIKV